MIRFGEAFRYVHRRTLAFAAAFPLVAAIPFAAELVQHWVEMTIGMYDGVAGMQAAAEADSGRLYIGFAKTIALGIPGYWLVRWLHTDGDRTFAARLEKRALMLFGLVVALQILFNFLALFVWTSGPISIGFMVFGVLFLPLISRFVTAAPLGKLITPRASMRVMAKDYPFALAFSLLAPLPLLALHYGLAAAAIYAPGDALKWAILVVDCGVTAWLALVIIAAAYTIATRLEPLWTSDPPTASMPEPRG